jgi:ATP-dependent Lhr-like helicase
VTPGSRLAALTGNRFLLRDGVPLAIYAAGQTQFLEAVAPTDEWQLRNALLRQRYRTARDRVHSA